MGTQASVALASGTTLAGVFGMNLVSGLEDHSSAFFWASGLSAMTMAALYFGVLRNVRPEVWSAKGVTTGGAAADVSEDDATAVRSVFGHLDEVQRLLATARREKRAGRGVSRAELRGAMTRICVDLSEVELNLLFDSFDLDRSGMLSERELTFADTTR